MTCAILHRDGWAVADKHVSFSHYRFPTEAQKIMRFSHTPSQPERDTLVAAAGAAGANFDLRKLHYSFAGFDEVIEALCRATKGQDEKHERIFLMTGAGKQLVYIAASGVPIFLTSSYWAIGSGEDYALGFLAGLKHKDPAGDIAAIDAVNAIRYTSTMTSSVGYDTHMEHL